MIDIHTHILPGIDDGLQSYEDSLIFLRKLAKEGISKVCLTPHMNRVEGDGRDNRIQEVFQQLLIRKDHERMPIDLFWGAEVLYTPKILPLLEEHPTWFLGKQQRYFLLEFYDNILPYGVEKIVLDLLLERIVPVLTHIERYPWKEKDKQLLSYFRKNGIIMQINASSILGKYGWHMKKKARRLIKEGWCQVVASDAHQLSDLDYTIRKVKPVLSKLFGEATAEVLLVDNPGKVMRGEVVCGKNIAEY